MNSLTIDRAAITSTKFQLNISDVNHITLHSGTMWVQQAQDKVEEDTCDKST